MNRSRILVIVNQKNTAQRAQIVRCLLEGSSVRSTVRMTGAAKNTVIKLQVALGKACMAFHDETVRGLKSENFTSRGIVASLK